MILDARFHGWLRQKGQLMADGHAEGAAVGPALRRTAGVLLAGMGGSGAAGRLVRDAWHEAAAVPILHVQDDRLPGCVGEEWTVFALSYSGDTEETLRLAREARRSGAHVVGITTGGKLADEVDTIIRPPSGYAPRAAMGFMWMAVLGALEAGDIITPVPLREVLLAVAEVDRACGHPEPDNPALAVAQDLRERIPVFYATPALAGVACFAAALFNENAKRIAFHGQVPEANHNDLVGWSGDPQRSRFAAVVLADAGGTGEMAHRLDYMRRNYKAWGVSWHEPSLGRVITPAEAVVVQAIAVQWTEYISLYAASLAEVDPGDIAAIQGLKRTLRESEAKVTVAAPGP